MSDDITRLRNEVNALLAKVRAIPGGVQVLGDIQRVVSGETMDGGILVPLAEPKTSSNWNGAAKSSVGTATAIDLSAEFGVPDGVKAILLRARVNDSGTAGGNFYFACGPSAAQFTAFVAKSRGGDEIGYYLTPVPCDANGDVWYRIAASGTGTIDVDLQIYGWWI